MRCASHVVPRHGTDVAASLGKDCFLGLVGCFLCFECCEGCCDCIGDIICTSRLAPLAHSFR